MNSARSSTPMAWIDARIGIAGDMLLGACLAAGADLNAVQHAVHQVTGGVVKVQARREQRCGLAATRAVVTIDQDAPAVGHRNLADITRILRTAELAPDVCDSAIAVFTLIAEAEAECHGSPVAEVHFHEVGAWDTIADVVGVLTAWRSLGCPQATGSLVGVGAGLISTEHGTLSVPAPAVAALLTRAGAPSAAGPLHREAATPTGAALLAHLCDGRWGEQPPMSTSVMGFGAGSADPPHVANVTRVILGQPLSTGEPTAGNSEPATIVELTCNIDDLDPRAWPSIVAALLARGALDCWHAPITMKRGRPGRQLFVLCHSDQAGRLREAIFDQTPTLGVRWRHVDREVLDRHFLQVTIDGHPIAVKVGFHGGRATTIQPEWRDVERAAAALNQPVRTVLAQAQSEALRTLS